MSDEHAKNAPRIQDLTHSLSMMDGPLLIIVIAPKAAFEKMPAAIQYGRMDQREMGGIARNAKLRALESGSPVVLTMCSRNDGLPSSMEVIQDADLVLDVTKSRSW